MQTTVTEEMGGVEKAALLQEESHKNPGNKAINSRFGEIQVDTKKAICFEHGLLGIPGKVSFCLTKLPNCETDQFKLLQCLEDHDLSFIVVPAGYDNQLIHPQDIDDACQVLDINKDNLLLFFIVTVHVRGKERHMSVNAKAPIFVDAVNQVAVQYVFQGSEYQIQHMIS